jgi:predicted DNA binding protein
MRAVDDQSIIVELDVTSPRVVLGPTLSSDLDVAVYAEQLPISHEETTWFDVTVSASDFEAFERAVEEDPTVEDAEVFVTYDERRTYRLTIASEVPVMTNHIASFGDELLTLRSTANGWRAQIRTTDRASIRDFMDFCEAQDIDCRLYRLFEAREPIGEFPVPVEPGEFEILRAAYDAGYFEVPRETDLSKLADQFDIAESTMSVRLRNTLDHVVETVLFGANVADHRSD